MPYAACFFYRWGDTDWYYYRRDRGETEAVERYLGKHKDSRLSEQKQNIWNTILVGQLREKISFFFFGKLQAIEKKIF